MTQSSLTCFLGHFILPPVASFPVATYGLGHRSLKVLWLALLDLLILMFKTLWISSCLLIDASYDILYMPWFGPWKLLAPRSLPILIKYWFETKYPMRIHEIEKSLIRSKTLPRNNKKIIFESQPHYSKGGRYWLAVLIYVPYSQTGFRQSILSNPQPIIDYENAIKGL